MDANPAQVTTTRWLRQTRFAILGGLLVMTAGIIGQSTAEAVQIKKVYRGVADFDATDIVQSVILPATVDTTKSIILLTNDDASNTADENNFFSAQFEDPSTITINRSGVTVAAGVSWQIIEFTDGVNVQRGISSLQAGVLSKTINLPNTITSSKAVPIVYPQNTETGRTITHQLILIPTLSNTQMTLTRLQSTGTKALTLTWQVIEFLTDANVYSGVTTFAIPGATTTNQTASNDGIGANSGALSPALSNSGLNALLFFYLNPGTSIGGIDNYFYTRGTITNNTTVTFTRQLAPTGTNTAVKVQYYVVDFTDGTNALGFGQKGLSTQLSTTPTTVAISSSTDTAPIVITTAAAHNLTTGNLVDITAHATNTNANGVWTITTCDAGGLNCTTAFKLNSSTATGLGAGINTGTVYAAINNPLTAVTTSRALALSSASGGGIGTTTSTSWGDDLSVASYLTTVSGANNLSVVRSSATVGLPADVNYFAYEFPPLTVKSPNGGEIWKVQEIRNITWKHSADLETGGTCNGGVGPGHKLKIELSRDSGSTYLSTTITSDVCANLDTFAWTIPASMVDGVTPMDLDVVTLRVKMTDMEAAFSALPDARRADVSNANFEIKGTLTITAPNTNLTWFVGDTTRNITWTKTGNLDDNGTGKVRLELWTSGGAAYDSDITTALTDPLASALTYLWNPIPDKIGPWRVKTKHLADPTGINDFSDVDFNVKGTMTVTYPNGGETLESLKTYTVTWNKTGTFPGGNLVNLFYSTDSGGTWTAISSCTGVAAGAASGSCNWTVPSAVVGTNTRIRVQQAGDPTVTDDSNANFTVVASIVVTSPNVGTEIWQVSTTQNITWTINGTGITGLKLEYSTNGFADETQTFVIGGSDVTSIPPSPASYAWTIPNSIGTNIKVRIRNFNIPSVFDVSDNPFTIKSRVHVLVPNSGEVWTVGSSRVIQWENFGTLTGNVKILYSTDGVNFPDPGNLLTSTTPVSALSYTWNPIPDQIGTTVKVRVAPLDVNGVSDDSDANFAIKGTLTIGAPLGGESWIVGTSHNITWTKTGSIGAVKLLYSTDGGITFPDPANVIASGLDPVLGTPYAWTIPDNISGLTRVRVQLVSDPTVNGTTPANFNIKGSLTLTAPNGTPTPEIWIVGETTRQVTWTRVGTTGLMTGNVQLEYSTDGGLTYPNLINNTTPASALTYTWNPIPDAIGTNRRVKISLVSDPLVNDTSDANFTIKGKLTVTAPNTNVTWIVGSSQNITWTTNGTISTVNLYYSTNSGTSYLNTIATAISNIGSYAWTIPDSIGTTLRVKVESVADASVFDASDVDFTIKGSLTITAPNTNVTWIVGGSQNITWTKTGTLSGNVKLVYSTDGGVTYPEVTPNNVITTMTLVTALSYAWTIPDAIGTSVKVKIVYLNDTAVADESDTNFTVKGSLTLTVPDGGEVWVAGTTQNVTWNKTGTLGPVKLEYSTDGGVTYPNLVIGSTPADTDPPTGPNNGQYAWVIPAGVPLSATGRIKVTLLSDTAVNDASNNNFRVRGNVTVTAPNGGQTWIVGATQNITWTITGAISNVKLEYSKNAFADEFQTFLITASTAAGALSYPWPIPDAIGSNLKVRVSDAADATVTDVSDAPFTIKGSVTVTAPNGGQTWIVGSTQNIAWTMTGTLGNVKLEYSTNSFANELQTVLIIASTTADTAPTGDNAGSYAWLIPDSIGATTKVRVSQATDSTVVDTSDLDFTIKGSLTITAPNGAEQWAINSAQTITWAKTGTLTGNLKLEYSTDGGVTYLVVNLISNTVLASSTSFAWTIPDNPTTQARVKITYLNDTTVFDQSDANFSIKGSLFITVPNGSEVWKVGEVRNITWTRGGAIANAKLDYSTDSGATYPNAIVASTPAANLSYAWTIPDSISNTVRVRITDVGDATVNDASDGNFSIKGTLTLTAPTGGETWIVNSVQNITWTKTGTIPNVKLEYSRNGFIDELQTVLIVASTPGANLTYAWTIPDAIGNILKVRMTNVSDATVLSVSGANFTIKGSLTLTSPVGGETWIVNSAHNITWTKQGSIANVKLEYSKNGFLDELQTFVITASTPAAPLSYAWTVPDAIGTAVKVRVSDASDSAVNSRSGANFTIKGSLTLTAPNGSEVWTVLSSRNITWTKVGSIVNVQLQYSTDGGSTFPNTVTTSTDATLGSYAWTIPDAIGATVKVRVANTADTTVFDDSDANFKIVGVLSVTTPVGGEKWTVGSAQTITWTRTGSIANVKLEYSTDGSVTYPNLIIATTPAVALSYAWTIPNSPSATVRVKISDVTDATVLAASAANFKIKAGLTVTVPNGGEVWTVGSPQTITWTTVGTAANVKLEYSTDGGTTYPNVIVASAANTGSFSWTVVDAISTTVRVKVTDAADADAFDESNANFKIRGALTVTAPNGAEGWAINTTQTITWTRVGTVVNVKLEYSTNGFADELQTVVIVASTPGATGTYAWLIPDAPSATVKVRASDASDATVLDLSNANFSIKGSLTVTAPNSGEVWVVGNTNNITWTKFGAIANVKLEYSTDGGVTYPVGNLITASTAASTLSYSWTIPDSISSTVRVRITDVGDGTVNDQSDANFKIRGSITVTAPTGGQVWIVGASQNITWTKTGSFPNVKLEYSTNAFLNELQTVLITASALAAPLSFAWTIPDAIGTNLKVRASDAADATVTSTSAAAFTIKGSLTVVSPNGTEVWRVGESRNLTWTKTGSIAFVKLEYSTNGGTTYPNVITASTDATTGTYAWTVPDAIGATVRVRITNTADATVFDDSNANFEIKGQVTVTAPNGSEVWTVGSSRNLTWTKQGTFGFVKLEYSTNAFANELQTTIIAASVDAVLGTPYAWTVPDAIGTSLRVRITNTADAAVVDVSDANFKIVGSLTLTAPVGGESWTVGTSQNITWTKVGSIANVKLEYSTDGGTTYPNVIVASTAAGTGAFAWTIPDAIGANRRVRIADASDATVFSTSAANFKILGGFTLSAPNGGEVWTVGASQNITWATAGTVANVKLEYSTDGGSTYPNVITASTANTGTFAWTVPDAISTTVKVRISDVLDATAFKVSAANFKIRGSLLVTAPNGGEGWPISTVRNVTWTKTGSIASVKLEYSTDGGLTYPAGNLVVASTAAATLSYAWTIPDAPTVQARVKITDVSDSTVFDESNANFSIKGLLTIGAPNGGEVWIVGSSYNITWTKFGAITSVKLQYSTDGGVTWPDPGKVIIASTAASLLSYTWTIPDDISNIVRVRITDTGDASVFDDSNANFSVKGSVTVTAPNGGETWIVTAVQNITWTKTGSLANVKLEYSKNGFTDELQTFLMTASVPATTGTPYAWTIPDAISNTVKVRVSNVTDATVLDVSDANFAIKGSLTLNAPNGGETWIVGASQPVTWSKVGSIANVKLEYSTDGGVSYPNLIVASTPASAGSYTWAIPDAITTTARVKVSDVSDSSVFDASDANFKIAGSLTVTAPNGAEAWLIGATQNITWTKTGSIANVKLEYSTNGGTTYPNLIIASVSATTGTPYAWVIPDAPSTQAKVKVTNTADATVFDESNANFNIRGSVTLTSPVGSEVWVVGSARNITWTRTGSFANVKLEYSTDGGVTYPNLITASTLASTLSYAWTVPDAISTTVRVKITDAGDSAVTASSTANFKIKGSVNLTAPNGAEVWIVGATQNITWTRTGSFANVKLEYSTNGFFDELQTVLISASAPAAPLSYAWTAPDAIGSSVKVRISDAADATVTATSAANFTIKGSLTLNAPNGVETWIVGATQNITWGKTGTIASVKLEYSTDGGVTYPNVITASIAGSALTYAWAIPDNISSTVRVKVTNLADTTVTSSSAANFKISGSLTLTSPVGGEVWIVGSTRNITWTKSGSIATAKLEYSTDGGVTYPNVITPSVAAAALTFAWTVPDNMSSTIKVKITNTADATVSSASTSSFKIAGSFTIVAPNGSEKWAAGSTQSITWTKTGSIVNAKLEYSTDGGLTYPNLIVATVPANSLSYAWVLGTTTSTQVRVRITDVSDSMVFDTSNANFKIMGGFTVSSPNGGEVWVVGETRNILWSTVGSVANVKLSYSVNGGTTYPNTITATTTNTGSYAWTIPDSIGTTLKVKVEDVLDVDAFDESNANFKIRGSLTVTAPNGAEIWTVASSQNITWTKTGSIANVKLEYSTDGGLTYPAGNLIAASVVASLGTYAWTIPDAISTTVKVRITDLTDATVFDESNANFTIRGSFTFTAPNGGQKWTVGTTQPITWTTFGTIPNVKLEYSTDGGVTYPTIITASSANTGIYNWSVPNAISSTVRVRVSNAADPGTLATSAVNFKIMAGFTVTAPNGGEVVVVGSPLSITWTTAGTVSNIKLEYSTNGGTTYPNVITASSPNTGIFNWTVPDAISATVRIRVSDATDTVDAFDTSDGNFKIRANFTVTAPNGGEAWVVGAAQNITWTSAGTVANVKLEYSTDGGTTYPNVITASVANAGTYAWTIPDAITTAARVKVSDVNDSTSSDASNTNFKIQGFLAITAPNGGEKWTVGSVRTVTWSRTGSISFVKLEFSTNGGSLYAPITASTSNTGSYAWTVPDNISTNCLVKVSDTNDATVNDVSDAAFKIQAGFTVTVPNGGEVWGVGSARTITWTTNGTVSFVKIDLSSDSGVTFPTLITSSTSNLGTYAWTVPDLVSGALRVRVSQTTDAEAFDASDGNFRIRATCTLSSPNGTEQWRVGQSQNITWSVVGTIPNVKLQYSRDNFTADLQTITASTPNASPYAWTIPDAISNTVRVRVSDPNDIGAFDDSNADFRITGDFTVTAPNGSEQWIVGTSQNITWTKTGSVTNAKIEYSTNSGGTWTSVAGLTPNNGTFAWTIPDAITAQARVRLSDPADATANDISNADFKIKAGFTVSAPNGSEVFTVGTSQNVTWTNTGTVPNVKLDYSTNSGTTYPTAIVATVVNTGTYAWTIPDAISTTVRVKVGSTTDVDAFDTSNADFKIRGALTLTAPNGGEGFKIAQSHNITWTTTGTIPNVKLTYSTNGGATYPNVITASVVNTNIYVWVVPDVPTTTARVRVENVTDSTVLDDSNANFSLQGNFTITSPNSGEVWTVTEIRNITWSWGGTIPTVKLTYSTNGGATYPSVIVATAPNGVGSSGSFSYAWTVPDSISTTVRVKIEDVTDPAVFDTSNANFKIQGKLTIVTPNGGGGQKWVTNETRAITWLTNGTIPTVKLESSTDGGLTYPAANIIVSSTANTGTYNWIVPNTQSTTVRVRVVNTADATVYDESDANFEIGLYTVTFQVKDLLSNNNLDQLTVNASTSTNPPGYTWAASALTSPIVKPLQFGTWTAMFTRVSYGDQSVSFVVDRDQTIQVFMETQVVHIWEAVTEIAYVTATDTATITSTLRRDGSTVPGAVSCAVKFYDAGTLIKTVTAASAPDAQGFYGFTWAAPTGLVAGKVYNVVTTVTIATGGVFNTPRTFSVTEAKKLQDVQDTVNQKLDIPLSQVKNEILTPMQTKLDDQKTFIKGAIGFTDADLAAGKSMKSELVNQTGLIQTKMDEFTGRVATSLVSLDNAAQRSQVATKGLENAAVKSQAAAAELEKVGKRYSGRLLVPTSVLMGEAVTLRYRAGVKLTPLVDISVADKEGKIVAIVKAQPMVESPTQPGLYEYKAVVTKENRFIAGKPFTVFVQEATTGNLEAGSVFVETTSLGSLEGLVAADSGAKRIAQETLNTIKAIQGVLSYDGDVGRSLESLKGKLERLPKAIAEEGGTAQNQIKTTINQVAEQIKTLAGDEGYDFSQLVKKGLEESPTIGQIRQTTDEVQGATEVMQVLMERKLGGVDDPVIAVTFQ